MKMPLTYGLAALAICLALPAPICAQSELPPTGADQIGIYTAPDFDGPNAVFTTGTVGEEITAYIVLTGLTATAVGGFECAIAFAGASEVLTTVFPVEALDIQPEPEQIAVGFATPVPADDGVAMVATLVFRLLADPEWLFLGPLPSLEFPPFEMVYVAGDGFTIHTLHPSSGAHDLPVFAVNSEDVVTVRRTTWSATKSLYR